MKSARRLALDALVRIDEGGYANLVVPALLDGSALDRRDRALVTELVYGATRMRRACDWLLASHVSRPLDALDRPVRAALRLGAYQLHFMRTPPHAAVSATVDIAPRPARGLVNAVLRKVAADPEPQWPDAATRLSYPDWIVERLVTDLGQDAALAALATMNEPGSVTERADGYVQDEASQLVAAIVAGFPGGLTADVCAAPGGKATAIASSGGLVVAADIRWSRAGLVAANAARLGLGNVVTVQADGRRPPFRPGRFDRVLVDAPCSGLGVLRRRPDARWRIQPEAVPGLVELQRELLSTALDLVRPGGVMMYPVCTLTVAESLSVDEWLAVASPAFEAVALAHSGPWTPIGRGARLLPQDASTDGMYVLALQAPG